MRYYIYVYDTRQQVSKPRNVMRCNLYILFVYCFRTSTANPRETGRVYSST